MTTARTTTTPLLGGAPFQKIKLIVPLLDRDKKTRDGASESDFRHIEGRVFRVAFFCFLLIFSTFFQLHIFRK